MEVTGQLGGKNLNITWAGVWQAGRQLLFVSRLVFPPGNPGGSKPSTRVNEKTFGLLLKVREED